ncbi:hypothetical protein LSAT2_028086 [Lamellibrachia satsuma]|nr:hypothetical protein LSAT2_028086 [Lamellibrachia satsuma]
MSTHWVSQFPAVVFSVVLRRRWVTLCLYLLYPNAVTNLLAMMIHLLPCDSTEKVTMGVFLFLTTVFYLKLLEAHLPAPGSIPLIVEHVLYTIIMSCLSQTIIIVVLHLHHNVKTPIPAWVRRVFLYYLSRVLRMNWVIRIEKDDVKVVARQTSLSSSCSSKISQKTTATARDVAGDDGYFEGGDLGERSPGHLLVGTLTGQTFFMGKDITEIIILKIDKCLQDFDDRTKRRLEEKVIRNEWKQVAMVIDRCMFYIYMFATCYLWMLFYNNTIVYTDPGIE